MKSVLISIQPKWCELIASGKKTVEVRKTKPKLETPFKCYIYETQGRTETPWIDEDGHEIFKGRGQVIGEFMCDCIYGLINFLPYDSEDFHHDIFPCVLEQTCLEDYEIDEYLGRKDGYGWHISDLVIYDKPRKLSEFFYASVLHTNCFGKHTKRVTRPPQSWCYVETKEGE